MDSLYKIQLKIATLERDKAVVNAELASARLEEKNMVLDHLKQETIPIHSQDLTSEFDWGPKEVGMAKRWQEGKMKGGNDTTKEGISNDHNVHPIPKESPHNKTPVSTGKNRKIGAIRKRRSRRNMDIGDKTFTFHDRDNNDETNQLHDFVCREIMEGFFVSASVSISSPRLKKFSNTIGFRCKWCKDVGPEDRAERASVHPSSIKGIYRSILRFQKAHIL